MDNVESFIVRIKSRSKYVPCPEQYFGGVLPHNWIMCGDGFLQQQLEFLERVCVDAVQWVMDNLYSSNYRS
jgi:hypothetical protein